MDRDLQLPALVLLDEIGAGTDPLEGGALGVAIVDHFRTRGALVVGHDALRRAEDVRGDDARRGDARRSRSIPVSFAPTYHLLYGSPGRSLALEMAERLGLNAVDHRRGARSAWHARGGAGRSTRRRWTTRSRALNEEREARATSARRCGGARERGQRDAALKRARGGVPAEARTIGSTSASAPRRARSTGGAGAEAADLRAGDARRRRAAAVDRRSGSLKAHARAAVEAAAAKRARCRRPGARSQEPGPRSAEALDRPASRRR